MIPNLDEYALENPDTLFIYDLSLVCDRRLFPDTLCAVLMGTRCWPSTARVFTGWLVASTDPAACGL